MNQYVLKFDYIGSARIGRILKNILKDASDDRKAANELYEVASKAYKQDPLNSDLGKLAVDLLKTVQASNSGAVRSAEIMLKYLNGVASKPKPAKKKKGVPSFSDLSSLSEEEQQIEE